MLYAGNNLGRARAKFESTIRYPIDPTAAAAGAGGVAAGGRLSTSSEKRENLNGSNRQFGLAA